tara:strand:+ start:282 stop:509 length:228 start_codon:yes stop_codon:yes gene_type:complete
MSILRTPKDVAPRIIRVKISAKNSPILLRNIMPRVVSIKGYKKEYKGILFAIGSYFVKAGEKFLKSKNLKKLKTI